MNRYDLPDEGAIRFAARDLKEMMTRGLRRSDPHRGRCLVCRAIVWYADLAQLTDLGPVHVSCQKPRS